MWGNQIRYHQRSPNGRPRELLIALHSWNCSLRYTDASTEPASTSWLHKLISPGPITVAVLAVLSFISGSVYAYLYITRIKPRTFRTRHIQELNQQEEDANSVSKTHLFLFRRPWGGGEGIEVNRPFASYDVVGLAVPGCPTSKGSDFIVRLLYL